MCKERVGVFWECCQLGLFAMCLALRRPPASARRSAWPSPNVECSAELNNKKISKHIPTYSTYLSTYLSTIWLLPHGGTFFKFQNTAALFLQLHMYFYTFGKSKDLFCLFFTKPKKANKQFDVHCRLQRKVPKTLYTTLIKNPSNLAKTMIFYVSHSVVFFWSQNLHYVRTVYMSTKK